MTIFSAKPNNLAFITFTFNLLLSHTPRLSQTSVVPSLESATSAVSSANYNRLTSPAPSAPTDYKNTPLSEDLIFTSLTTLIIN